MGVLYSGLAHTDCTELNLHYNKLSDFSLSTQLVRPHGLGSYEGKGAAGLGCGGREVYTPKPILLQGFMCQLVVGSITPNLGGQQPETACCTGLEMSQLTEPWHKTSVSQEKSMVMLRTAFWSSRIQAPASSEYIPGWPATFIENFTPRTFLEKQQEQMSPVDREESSHLSSCKNSIHIIPVNPTSKFPIASHRRMPPALSSLQVDLASDWEKSITAFIWDSVKQMS